MADSILQLEELSIGYKSLICKGISAAVGKGELVGLAGKNGSGKSTLIKSVLGLLTPHGGKIHFEGKDIGTWSHRERARHMAVVFSRLEQPPPIPVSDLLSLGRLPYKGWNTSLEREEKKKIIRALESVGIRQLKDRMANELSDGQLQMVMIARALVQDTPLVVMDEPTSHLDFENQFRIFELIYKLSRETQKTFLIASHQVELLLQNSSQLWWIEEGEFTAGYPEQVAYENKIFDKLSQERIRFNYLTGRFEFQHQKSREVSFKGDGNELSYWVIAALDRNGFGLNEDSDIKIEVKEKEIRMNNVSFDSIESLLKKLLQ